MVFDKAESNCILCNAIICRVCFLKIDEKIYCCKCHKQLALNISSQNKYKTWSYEKLTDELKARNNVAFTYIDNATLEELQRIYEDLVFNNNFPETHVSRTFRLVSSRTFIENTDHLTTINIRHLGGSFISMKTLRSFVPEIIDLLAQMIDYDSKVGILPKIYIDWAKKSRTTQG